MARFLGAGSNDLNTGTVKQATDWTTERGLEWFYRLIQEPGGLWRPYFIGGAKFVGHLVLEAFHPRRFD